MAETIKVLIVDDSPLVRKIVSDMLSSHPQIEVVGTAANAQIAKFKIQQLQPDILTLDIEMPGMNGLDFLQLLMRENPMPVIMMSVLTQTGADATFKALEFGAFDFVPKPSSIMKISVDELKELLVGKVLATPGSQYFRYQKHSKAKTTRDSLLENVSIDSLDRTSRLTLTPQDIQEKLARYMVRTGIPGLPAELPSGKQTKIKFVLIGTSTGGPNALSKIIKQFPKNFPAAVLIVQHMPAGFTKAFANRLNGLSSLDVKEAENGDLMLAGRCLVAPGNYHMKIEKKAGNYFVTLDQSPQVNGHRPSVDAMFQSALPHLSSMDSAIAIIMTGMGKDGAIGMRLLKEKGSFCIAQDAESSVVFGMNKEAILQDGVHAITKLEEIIPLAVSKL